VRGAGAGAGAGGVSGADAGAGGVRGADGDAGGAGAGAGGVRGADGDAGDAGGADAGAGGVRGADGWWGLFVPVAELLGARGKGSFSVFGGMLILGATGNEDVFSFSAFSVSTLSFCSEAFCSEALRSAADCLSGVFRARDWDSVRVRKKRFAGWPYLRLAADGAEDAVPGSGIAGFVSVSRKGVSVTGSSKTDSVRENCSTEILSIACSCGTGF